MTKRTRHAVTPKAITRDYRGGRILCYPAVQEYYPSFDGAAIFGTFTTETQAQAAIDDRRAYLVERGMLTPEPADLVA